MNKPILVVLAAGMGSRYGGLKQMDPVGNHGEFIIDYSIYDAVRAGFGKVIFIINRRIEDSFKETIGARLASTVEIDYAYQELDLIPDGIEVPENRTKPYGTAHALYAAGPLIDGPFAVINADDYYGRDAYEKMYDFLTHSQTGAYGMIGYLLKNTVSDFGYVSRGICQLEEGKLMKVEEKVRIEKTEEGIAYYEENQWHPLKKDTVVSMNMWGADRSLIDYIASEMKDKLSQGLAVNPEKFEYYLPFAIDEMLQANLCTVRCMVTEEIWYGITYEEDKAFVVEAIGEKIQCGKYPDHLWEAENE